MERIYLDNAATAPLRESARQAMVNALPLLAGNPSSLHADGRAAKDAIDEARALFAETLGCLFAEVIFTGSGTEAANQAVIGAALGTTDPARRRVLLGAAEHHCVLHTQPILERLGFTVELIPVSREGQVEPTVLAGRLGPDVAVVAVMHANNELGTFNPIDELGAEVRSAGAVFVVDAVQTFPWYWAGDIEARPYDVVTLAAHKFGGPPGVGALYIRGGVNVEPLVRGGGQERELRAGTENVLGIIGAAAALREARQEQDRSALAHIRDGFVGGLGPNWQPTVRESATLPGHAHGRFPGISADSMLIRLDGLGISASSGAACSSGSIEPSHVMLACGYSETEALEALRFTLGAGISRSEAEEAARRIRSAADAIYALRRPTG